MELNKQQLAAVTAADGPALVLAGAGTGKTRVIVERLAWLVEEKGIDERNLLALTFTNKAAAEMKARFARRLGLEEVRAWLGTFHSFGLFVLRREMEHLGRSKTFSIFDDSDQLSLMKRLVKGLPAALQQVTPREALSWVSRLKQSCETPTPAEEGMAAADRALRELWLRYHDALRQAGGVDFDDLLVLLVELFDRNPEVLRRYQSRYRYVVIDEYQDTNRAQYLIARALTQEHGNIFVVGDEDQSIYSWRGADINNILDFAQDFPDAEVYRLELNYRSTKPILDAANALVENNVNRLGKTLRTQAQSGEKVRLHVAESGEEEASWVVGDIQKRSLEPRHTAILFRTNGQARQLEEDLRKRGVNYTIVGGIKFYARKEIKDIVSFLRLIVNASDDESLRRIVNVPPRGIGAQTQQRFEEYATARKEPLLKVLRDVELDDTIPARARAAAGEFVSLIDDLAMSARTEPVTRVVETLLERTGYREHVRESDEKDFKARLEIVDEFLSSCKQYDAHGGGSLQDFLQDLALVSDTDSLDPEAPAVTLMTIHSAKGLEFEHVYIVGLEEGLLPLLREFDDEASDVEEERRLCYVAMTRARKTLTLTAAQTRLLYGTRRDLRTISRFITEIGSDKLQRADSAPLAGGPKRPPQMAARSNSRTLAPTPGSSRPAATAPAGTAQKDAGGIRMGTKVRHAKFGPGVVQYTSGAGDKLRARIRFNTGRSVMLMISQAPIEILD